MLKPGQLRKAYALAGYKVRVSCPYQEEQNRIIINLIKQWNAEKDHESNFNALTQAWFPNATQNTSGSYKADLMLLKPLLERTEF